MSKIFLRHTLTKKLLTLTDKLQIEITDKLQIDHRYENLRTDLLYLHSTDVWNMLTPHGAI